jgi:hypothetical protein
MKITDISSDNVNEGPMDFARRAIGAVAQPIKTATQAVSQAGSARAGNKRLEDVAKNLFGMWQTQVASLNAAGINMKDSATYQQKLLDWFSKTAFKKPTTAQQMGNIPGLGAAQIYDYFKKGVGLYLAGQLDDAQPTAASTPTANPATGGAAVTSPGTSGAPGTDTPATGGAAVTSPGTSGAPGTDTPAAEPAPDPARDPLFKDPNVFKAEWDKYMSTQSQPYQLISDTRMLEVLKSMWMRTGGTKLAGNEMPKTTNDKFGNPVAAQPTAPAQPSVRQKYFSENKKIKGKQK